MPYVFGMPEYLRSSNMGAAVSGPWLNCKHATIVTFVAKWAAPAARVIVHDADDAVVAGTGTWRFDNGAFTAADVGATFTIANAANGGNNGAKIILTVVDGTHVTTATTSLVNETFGGTVTNTLQQLSPTGTFGAQGSNDGPAKTATGSEEPSGECGPATITVTVAPANPAATASAAEVKLALPVGYGWVRLTYTPTTGGGLLDAAAMAKAY